MGASEQGRIPEPVTVRAGQIIAVGHVNDCCLWDRILDEAERGAGNVIADLADTAVLTPRAAQLIGYVSELLRPRGRKLGVLANGPVLGMFKASAPPASLAIASTAGELADLWRADK